MAQQKTCAVCGVTFTCGVGDADTACWCTALPNVMSYPGAGDCLCPTCLQKEIDRKIMEKETQLFTHKN